MERLGMAANKILGSQESAQRSARDGSLARWTPDQRLPAMYVPDVDKVLPNSIWCGWRIDGKTRKIRRPLTDAERGMLERRVAELDPVMRPYEQDGDEADQAAEAVTEMFAGFPGMRATGADAIAKVDATMRLLAEFPLWAVLHCCERIRVEGYEVTDRDGARRERHWPPADAEIVAEIRRAVKLRAEALASARALLAAEVDR